MWCENVHQRQASQVAYKIWCLCGTDGYSYHLQIYTGNTADGNMSVPLGSRVINDLIDSVKPHTDLLCRVFYFDYFFTSYSVLKELAD